MRIFCLFFLFLANAAFAQLIIGKPIPNDIVIKSSNEFLLIKAGQLSKKYEVISDKIHYEISLDDNKNIQYIGTSDSGFKTSDNLSIGMEFKEITHAKIDNLKIEKGWAKSMSLESGWNAAFDFKAAITPTSKILFFFKRK